MTKVLYRSLRYGSARGNGREEDLFIGHSTLEYPTAFARYKQRRLLKGWKERNGIGEDLSGTSSLSKRALHHNMIVAFTTVRGERRSSPQQSRHDRAGGNLQETEKPEGLWLISA